MLRTLGISTNLRLNPGFVSNPAQFARDFDVPLVGDFSPETSFKKGSDSHKRITKDKGSIHLVQYGAIKIFVSDNDGSGSLRIRSIKFQPSLLVHGNDDHSLTAADLEESLRILRAVITPLLSDPQDSCHIVPGHNGDGVQISYWNLVESGMSLPGIRIACLHDLSHPELGRAEGGTKKRITLGKVSDGLQFVFEKAALLASGPSEEQSVEGLNVSLIVRGHAVPKLHRGSGGTAKVNGSSRLVALLVPAVTQVFQETMSRLRGVYLPIPPEWAAGKHGNSVTPAKLIALVSKLTPMPIEELRAMDEDLRKPSASTLKRLNKDVPAAVLRLNPLPVSMLFPPAACSSTLDFQ